MWLNVILLLPCTLIQAQIFRTDYSRYGFRNWGCFKNFDHHKYSKDYTNVDEGIDYCRKEKRKAYFAFNDKRKVYCVDFSVEYFTSTLACSASGSGLQVFRVCDKHKFGDTCEKDCHCTNDKTLSWKDVDCNPVTGECRYGEYRCQSGWWDWPRCQKRCQCLPRGDMCDKNSGKCGTTAEGCAPGYREFPTCQEKCRAGSWGMDCTQKCSWHCANNDSCSVEDGSCAQGECQEGWHGSKCELPIVTTPIPSTPRPSVPNQSAPNPSAPSPSSPNPSAPSPSAQNPSKAMRLSDGFGLVILSLLIAIGFAK